MYQLTFSFATLRLNCTSDAYVNVLSYPLVVLSLGNISHIDQRRTTLRKWRSCCIGSGTCASFLLQLIHESESIAPMGRFHTAPSGEEWQNHNQYETCQNRCNNRCIPRTYIYPQPPSNEFPLQRRQASAGWPMLCKWHWFRWKTCLRCEGTRTPNLCRSH